MSKLKHVTEHDGSRWVELEVAEGLYDEIDMELSALVFQCEHFIPAHQESVDALEAAIERKKALLTKARGESK